jgi:tripartite-type tricarboxylate transporter receptor subunit TctC
MLYRRLGLQLLRLLPFLAGFAFAAAPAASHAQTYPTKPLRFIVPFPPGGGTDILARLIAERLSERLRFQVVVDNRPGAGTNIGMEIAARALPDGHTLLMASVGVAANPSLYRNMAFDPRRDLAPVTLAAIGPTVLVTHPSLPAKTPQELIKMLRAQPGRFNYGSFGSASGSHLAAELFKLTTATEIVHIPYKGGGPGIAALLGNEVQIVFSSLLPTLPHIKSARMHAIGLAAAKRSPVLPGVPTFKENGIDYETGPWFGVLLPVKTPVPVIARLHTEITGILRSQEVKARVGAEGAEIVADTPEHFARFIAAEAKRWAEVVKRADIRVE